MMATVSMIEALVEEQKRRIEELEKENESYKRKVYVRASWSYEDFKIEGIYSSIDKVVDSFCERDQADVRESLIKEGYWRVLADAWHGKEIRAYELDKELES